MHIKINLQQNYINITLAFLIFINLKKNPGGLGFFKKTRVISSPALWSSYSNGYSQRNVISVGLLVKNPSFNNKFFAAANFGQSFAES